MSLLQSVKGFFIGYKQDILYCGGCNKPVHSEVVRFSLKLNQAYHPERSCHMHALERDYRETGIPILDQVTHMTRGEALTLVKGKQSLQPLEQRL